jgi:hypothetical protein
VSSRKGPDGERVKLRLGDRRITSDQYGIRIDFPPAVLRPNETALRPEALVLGVETPPGGTRAYPVNLLRAHVVNDDIDGQPVVITYCPRCCSGIAFDPTVAGERLLFAVFGNERYRHDKQKYRLIVMDESGTLWDQEGRALFGKLRGASLTPLPTEVTAWREWQRRFPNSSVMTGDESRSQGRLPLESLLFRVRDGSQPLEGPVLGVADGLTSVAYSLKFLAESGGALADQSSSGPLVVLQSPATSLAKAFRAPKGAELEVIRSGGALIRDARSGCTWDASGEPVAGGKRLEPVPGQRITRLYGWLMDHPGSRVVGIEATEPLETSEG